MARRRRSAGRYRDNDYDYGYGGFRPYVPIAARRAQALLEARRAAKRGDKFEPVEVEGRGRKIAKTAWGAAWCDHIESYHDYENRLPRGRTYIRNGSVIDLRMRKGEIAARVVGSEMYRQTVTIQPCKPAVWKRVVRRASGGIGSLIELLEGRLSDAVMAEIVAEKDGLLPDLGQVRLDCSCPDWAKLCKHLAAVLYGVGVRLDTKPELLFELRGVDPKDLISSTALPGAGTARKGSSRRLEEDLGSVFGIELDEAPTAPAGTADGAKVRKKAARRKKTPRRKKAVRKKAVRKKAVRKATAKRATRVTRAELLACGVPAGTISTWLYQGVLLSTGERGTYRHTAKSRERLKRLGL